MCLSVYLQWTLLPPVIVDTTPSGKSFGDIAVDVQPNYTLGDVVQCQFWGANPRNNLRTNDTFLSIEMLSADGNSWEVVALDGHWETKMIWKREGVAESLITIEWDTADWIQPGMCVRSLLYTFVLCMCVCFVMGTGNENDLEARALSH